MNLLEERVERKLNTSLAEKLQLFLFAAWGDLKTAMDNSSS